MTFEQRLDGSLQRAPGHAAVVQGTGLGDRHTRLLVHESIHLAYWLQLIMIHESPISL